MTVWRKIKHSKNKKRKGWRVEWGGRKDSLTRRALRVELLDELRLLAVRFIDVVVDVGIAALHNLPCHCTVLPSLSL